MSRTSVTVARPRPSSRIASESLILVEVEMPKRSDCAHSVAGTMASFVIW